MLVVPLLLWHVENLRVSTPAQKEIVNPHFQDNCCLPGFDLAYRVCRPNLNVGRLNGGGSCQTSGGVSEFPRVPRFGIHRDGWMEMGVAMECVREDPAGATLAPPPQPRNEAGRQTSRNLTLPAAASQSAYRFARLNAALRRHCCSSVQRKERRGNIEAVEAAAVKRKLLRRSLSRCQMPDGYIVF